MENFDWNLLIRTTPDLPEAIMEQFRSSIDWKNVYFGDQVLSDDFISKFKDKFNREMVFHWQRISEKPLSDYFIHQFQDYVDWETISFNKRSENFAINSIGNPFRHTRHYRKTLLGNIAIESIGEEFQSIKNYRKTVLEHFAIKFTGNTFRYTRNYRKTL
jgi:hypothetical protein